jgi:hypothetical protein
VQRSFSVAGPYVTVGSGIAGTNFVDTAASHGFRYYYVVVAANANGVSPPSEPASAILVDAVVHPNADAHVRGGPHANTNYGTNQLMQLKEDPDPQFDREVFLRFDVTGRSNVVAAFLSLSPREMDAPTASLACDWVTTDAWSEGDLTWNNRPLTLGGVVTNVTGITTNEPVLIDVTQRVKAEAEGDGALTLRLTALTPSVLTSFASREQIAAQNRPQLILSSAPAPFVLQSQPASNGFWLSWSSGYGACRLWGQTNPAGHGLDTNWNNLGVVTSPTFLPANPLNGSGFFRLEVF